MVVNFHLGDKVIYNGFYTKEVIGTIIQIEQQGADFPMYTILTSNGCKYRGYACSLRLIESTKKEKKVMNKEEKELKKDIEILLNIYLSNRDMNRKEIKRFSERHFDIIEKQNAKNTLKRRGK